jgi:glucokinase
MRVVIGLDVGGTKTNATVLDQAGAFLVHRMVEVPSQVSGGPPPALEAIAEAVAQVIEVAGVQSGDVQAIGLATPGPASATGVISSRGSTNFAASEWWNFDVRLAVEQRLQVPVIYSNDGNAAALYAHRQHFGTEANRRSSIAAIVGTGLGGGVIVTGAVVAGAAGMAGELGHVHIPMEGLLNADQPVPICNCGFVGDLESVASLSGITNNLLPYWLTQYPDHPLAALPSIAAAAKEVRGHGERGDEMALQIFRQQAVAIGRMFTIAANFTDPDAYFVGGGVTDAAPHFRDWFLDVVRASISLRSEQRSATIALVPDLDMAGARGAAIAALQTIE